MRLSTIIRTATTILLPLMLAACKPSGQTTLSGSLVDRDGNVYRTVTIGGKTWMSENLRVSRYKNGESIPEVLDAKSWSTQKNGASSTYGNREENGKTYGRLYNWYAVNDPRGLAPEGWHVATDREWNELAETAGGEQHAGKSLKASGVWNGQSTTGTGSLGFNAQASGARRDTDGGFVLLGEFARFWTPTEADGAKAIGRAMEYYDETVRRGEVKKENGFAVRCVKD
jgi:uncharacterized protein (TIGR02145 family)